MADQDQPTFPIVYSFQGHPSRDGMTFAIEATCFDKSVVRFAIPVDNIQHLIAFLLIWVNTISLESSDEAKSEDGERNLIPIPARSIAIGESDGKRAYLGISVGRAELIFSLPASSLGSIGQSLLLAGQPVNAAPL